jgi:hypothetical protein
LSELRYATPEQIGFTLSTNYVFIEHLRRRQITSATQLKNVTMKIKEMAGSVLHFAVNIFHHLGTTGGFPLFNTTGSNKTINDSMYTSVHGKSIQARRSQVTGQDICHVI